jgi:hypothetical protein
MSTPAPAAGASKGTDAIGESAAAARAQAAVGQGGAPATTQPAHPAPGAIPFRQSSPASGPQVFGVLITTLLLLAAFYALATVAARKGWLQRWTGARATGVAPRLQVLERLQVSRRTTLLRVRDGANEYLVAESTGANVQIVPSPRQETAA